MSAQPVVEKLNRYFREHPEGIVSVYLFGSQARGTAKTDSDVDVAVLLERRPESTLAHSGMALEGDLEEELGKPVDLVLLNLAPVDLIHRVLRDGILVFDAMPSQRIRFEVQARNEYFDLKPYLDQYRRTVEERRG